MTYVHLVTVLALFQIMVFAILVGRARGTYGIKAPATTGNEQFERYYRVQMNTLELLVVLLPALWLAATYWSPAIMAGIGAVYLVGRVLYFRGYIQQPTSRTLGFSLSFLPILALLIAALAGIIRSL